MRIKIEVTIEDGDADRRETVYEFERSSKPAASAGLGLTLEEGRTILSRAAKTKGNVTAHHGPQQDRSVRVLPLVLAALLHCEIADGPTLIS